MEQPKQIASREVIIKGAQAMLDSGVADGANMLLLQHKIDVIVKSATPEHPNGVLVDAEDKCPLFLDRFITTDKAMIELKNDIMKLAPTEHTVLIVGPTGTGKELLARALHGTRKGEFVPLNCGGLPDNLIESELFGYTKGAFTDAKQDTPGLFDQAHNGTLFLDEIGEMPSLAQTKLLRALQSKKIRKVGGKAETEFNCRIVCATNIELRDAVREHKFRLDLLARISMFELKTTPLIERIDDVIPIVKSMEGGEEFLKACKNKGNLELDFNVRSLEQYVNRHKVLGKLP